MTNIKDIFLFYFDNYRNGSAYTIFWISIIIYSLGFLTYISERLMSQLSLLIMIFGLAGMALSFVKLIKLTISNIYLRHVFPVFMIWQMYIIMRGIQDFDFQMLLNLLFSPYYFLHYLVPLVILIPANIFFTRKTFGFFVGLSILLFVFFFLFTNEILYTNLNFSEQVVWTFGTGSGFILLTWGYHTKKIKALAFLTVLLCLVISSIMARRNLLLTFGNFLVCSLIIILVSSGQSIKSKTYLLTLIFVISALGYQVFFSFQDQLFGRITTHFGENTREIVFIAFFNDLTTKDLIIGKGFLGEYYCPGAEVGIDYRFLIESGYLQMILKGGIVSLGIFLLIALPAAYLGILKSNNILSKASGIIVLLWLIDMFPWGMPAINIRYILVWTCIGICYSQKIRNLTEAEIRNSLLLFPK